MRCIWFLLLLISMSGQAQWKDYFISVKGDTLNRLDLQNLKQGPWVNRIEPLRGEPGYEEEGEYVNNRKEGLWLMYSLAGDLVGREQYRWGLKDGVCTYFTSLGAIRLEQSWKALNPDKLYDTIEVEDVDKLNSFRKVVVKNEGVSLKHGTWKYYNPETERIIRTDQYELGKRMNNDPFNPKPIEVDSPKNAVKPKEVLDFEKKNEGKKKIRFRDGSTG